MLEYDNTAFYYFAITLLSIYLLPGFYYLIKEVISAAIGSGDEGIKARTSDEIEKSKKLKLSTTGFARFKKPQFIANAVVLGIITPIFIYLIVLVKNHSAVSVFDPFQILGIDSTASAKLIKKAYHKLSLEFHPDKNKGSKVAEEMFLKVTQAYEALTDPLSKENYEKFGNPNGKQSLEVSLGLPTALLENSKLVLVLYLIIMVILIPVGVGFWYATSKQYGEKNIMHETYTAFYQLITESIRTNAMVEIMAASAEFRIINTAKQGDAQPLAQLYEKMKSDKLMLKPKYDNPLVLRGNLLLHAHLLRADKSLTKELRKDLDLMLDRAPELIEGIIEISHQRKWLETTLNGIKFSQCMIQAVWPTKSHLLQIPHLTEKEIELIKDSGSKISDNFKEFIQSPKDELFQLLKLNSSQQNDINLACALFPRLSIKTRLYVEEEEEKDEPEKIYESDLVTLRVTLTRENVKENSTNHPVHAPHFPRTIRDSWWFILTDKLGKAPGAKPGQENGIHAVEKISDSSRQITHELRFMAPPKAGTFEMELHICNDCYLGIDEKITVTFTCLPASQLPEYAPHPEDVELDNEPTLFEQVMAANLDEDSSDDEDEDKKTK